METALGPLQTALCNVSPAGAAGPVFILRLKFVYFNAFLGEEGKESGPGGVSQVIFHFKNRNGFLLRKLVVEGARASWGRQEVPMAWEKMPVGSSQTGALGRSIN